MSVSRNLVAAATLALLLEVPIHGLQAEDTLAHAESKGVLEKLKHHDAFMDHVHPEWRGAPLFLPNPGAVTTMAAPVDKFEIVRLDRGQL